jgi:hypothetical protein
MPELLTDRETGPQRPDWLADGAVPPANLSRQRENREKYREFRNSGWKAAART